MSDYEMTRTAWLRNQQRFRDAAAGVWRWPFDLPPYRRDAQLGPSERPALAGLVRLFDGGRTREAYRLIRTAVSTETDLTRLVRPLCDLLDILGALGTERQTTLRVILLESHRRQSTYWEWSCATWWALYHAGSEDFRTFYHSFRKSRRTLIAIGYLLGECEDFRPLHHLDIYALASRIFGGESIDQAVARIGEDLQREYGRGPPNLNRLTSQLLLFNHSPRLEDLTPERFEAFYQQGVIPGRKAEVVKLSVALTRLGTITHPLEPAPRVRRSERHSPAPAPAASPRLSASPGWARWCQRWRDFSTLAPGTRQVYYHYLLKVGRWLAQTHPDVVAPDQWTAEIARECSGAIDTMAVGEYVLAWSRRWAEKTGQPLSRATRNHYLLALRTFFRDCQRMAGLSYTFDPRRSLGSGTPQ